MPTYRFKNTETGEVFEAILSLAERETFLAENPHITQEICAPRLGDPVRLGIRKVDDGFKDVLKKAKRAHRNSTINDF